MTNRAIWINRLGFLLVWILITAGVAFVIARNAADTDATVDVTAPLPPVSIDQRQTVSLADKTIAPVVSANGRVVWDGNDNRWLLVAPATSADVAYRLLDPPIGVKALINGGPAGFACPWAGLGLPDGSDAIPADNTATPVARSGIARFSSLVPIGSSDNVPVSSSELPGGENAVTGGDVTMRCEVPEDVRVVAGMTGQMVLQMGEPVTTQALPVTAVVGAADQGQVVVVHEDGSTETRPVELGVSDIYNIEITGGLEPSEQVLQNPTQFDFAQSTEE